MMYYKQTRFTPHEKCKRETLQEYLQQIVNMNNLKSLSYLCNKYCAIDQLKIIIFLYYKTLFIDLEEKRRMNFEKRNEQMKELKEFERKGL